MGIVQDNEHTVYARHKCQQTLSGALVTRVHFVHQGWYSMQLVGLPEEILVLILELAIRPSDHRLSLPNAQSLLTCRTFHPQVGTSVSVRYPRGAGYHRRFCMCRDTFG